MNVTRFEQLLNGADPSLHDFAGFVSVIEELPGELLWKVVSDYPKIHWTLRKAALSSLHVKIPKENVDNALDEIASRLVMRSTQSPT